ncbi:MAG: phosphoenolpyruvate hydrolase family protein [Rhodospirillales bacterium]|nr:phosphoenolpyruvate hydrolase family protein [Rhodospirillales bacterium]
MAGKFTKEEAVSKLRAERDAGRAVYDALCGTGVTAKMAARGGADLICTHILAYYRMQGLSSMAGYLPIADANALTKELGERSIINVVTECPVIAGILCPDPTRNMHNFVDGLWDVGFDGIMNCPTVALIDGNFRAALEETGMSYDQEVEVLGYASSKGMFTKAFCTTPEEALAMAEVGVDNIIIHYGNSSGGTIGSSTVLGMDESIERTAKVIDVLQAKHSDLILTCHGGSIENPEDFAAFLEKEPRLDGYVGGSSAERFPIEESVPRVTQGFKSVKLKK